MNIVGKNNLTSQMTYVVLEVQRTAWETLIRDVHKIIPPNNYLRHRKEARLIFICLSLRIEKLVAIFLHKLSSSIQ